MRWYTLPAPWCAASIALLAGCSGGASPSAPGGQAIPQVGVQSASHASGRPLIRNVHGVTPILGRLWSLAPRDLTIGAPASRKRAAGPASVNPDLCPGVPAAGVIYLSDNVSGNVTTWRGGPPYGPGVTAFASGYGWGVAATHVPNPNGNRIYLGSAADVIDTYPPCSVVPSPATYTGGNTGAPYGIAVANNGAVYATEWPNNTIDYWTAPDPTPPTTTTDPNMGLPYFLATDSLGNVYVSGWDPTFTQQQIDKCGPGITACTTFALVPSPSFPGGLFVDGGNRNVVVNNQDGQLLTYRPSGVLITVFNYSNGTNPLDYTAIAYNYNQNRVWGANIYLCASNSSGMCGDAQSQRYRHPQGVVGPLNGATPADNGGAFAQPLGIAAYKPGPN